MIEAIIIDDEPKAIELLESYCNRSDELICLKSFRNPIEALQFIEKKTPQLIFLDINMPNLSGMQLAKLIPTESHIVFTTAYSEYAVESYNLNAADYLLKPIAYKRFSIAIDKVSALISTTREIKTEHIKSTLIIKSGYEKHLLNMNDILYLEKDGNYMKYHTQHTKILARETISEALEKLPKTFMQVHKSYIVNTSKISKCTKDMIDIENRQIPMSATYRSDLFSFINKM